MNALRIVFCTLVFLLLFGSLETGLPWAVMVALAVNESLVFADRLLVGKDTRLPSPARSRRAARFARLSTRVQLAFRR
jgi:hypothetical protein